MRGHWQQPVDPDLFARFELRGIVIAAVRVHTTFRQAGYTPKPEETKRLEFRV